MNSKIEALIASYKLTLEQLKPKTVRKIEKLDKIETSKWKGDIKADGSLTDKGQAEFNDLFEDIQQEILEVFEDLEDQKNTPAPEPQPAPAPAPEPVPAPAPAPEKPKSFIGHLFGK